MCGLSAPIIRSGYRAAGPNSLSEGYCQGGLRYILPQHHGANLEGVRRVHEFVNVPTRYLIKLGNGELLQLRFNIPSSCESELWDVQLGIHA